MDNRLRIRYHHKAVISDVVTQEGKLSARLEKRVQAGRV